MTSAALKRPESLRIGRVLNITFSVIGRNIGLCVALALLFSGLPELIVRLLSPPQVDAMYHPSTIVTSHGTFHYSHISIGGGLVSYVMTMLLQSALVPATIEDFNGRRASFGDCVQTAISFLLPTVAISLLVYVGSMIAMLALVVPGIILWLGWSMSVPALIEEQQGVLGSMSRSRALAKGSRWALFGLFLILIVITMLIQWGMLVVLVLFRGALAAVGASLVQAVVSLLTSIVTAVSYVELRQAKEGGSVDELAEIFS